MQSIRLSLGNEAIETAKQLQAQYSAGVSLSTLVRRSLALLQDEIANIQSEDEMQIERAIMASHIPAHPAANRPL